MEDNMLAMVAISCECDDADRATLRELARRRHTSVGKLVREAIDKTWGDELSEIKPFFVARNGSQKSQSGTAKSRR